MQTPSKAATPSHADHHTQGEWLLSAVASDSNRLSILHPQSALTILADIYLDGVGKSEGQANARLIVAAPELLEALELVNNFYSLPASERLSNDSGIWEAVHAAIAKAKGAQ